MVEVSGRIHPGQDGFAYGRSGMLYTVAKLLRKCMLPRLEENDRFLILDKAKDYYIEAFLPLIS
jgi:hypothetical protein